MENKIRILIVEDEALIAEHLRFTLEDLGYEVTDTCYTFEQAVAAITHDKADLILMDINLGNGDTLQGGLDLAPYALSHGRPFIFLTAYSDMDTIRRATRLQPSGYLIKPVNAATLFATIQTAIERHSAGNTQPALLEPRQPDFFFVKVGTKNHKLMWDDVYCIEAGKNYVKLRLVNSKTEYPIRGTLVFVLEQLLPRRLQPHFLRINRSICINKKFITSFDADAVYYGDERFENTRIHLKELQALMEQ